MNVQRVSLALMLCVWVSLLLACGGAGDRGTKVDREAEKASKDKPAKASKDKPAKASKDTEIAKSASRTPWVGTLGTGATAYDAVPEPWKGQFKDNWKSELQNREDAVKNSKAALAKLNAGITKSKDELVKFEERYKDSIRQKEALTVQVHKERTAALAKATESIKTAELAVSAAEERFAVVQKNDPPIFPDPYSDCKTLNELQDRIVTAEDKKNAEEERIKAEEAARRAESEHDVKGLVFLKNSVNGVTREFTCEITGTVVNRTGKRIRYAQITFHLYDASGGRIGTAFTNISTLDPGEQWSFKAIGFERNTKTFKFSELEWY